MSLILLVEWLYAAGEVASWGWFALSEIVFGIVAGIVVTRSGKIKTHQTLSFILRMGIEAKEFKGQKRDEQ
jgi:hypothetical protein